LKELYDKTEKFIRKPLEKTFHNPTQGNRYLQSLMDLTYFSGFILVLVL
jgi:hypothetical protein